MGTSTPSTVVICPNITILYSDAVNSAASSHFDTGYVSIEMNFPTISPRTSTRTTKRSILNNTTIIFIYFLNNSARKTTRNH